MLWCTAEEGSYIFVNGVQSNISNIVSGAAIAADKTHILHFYGVPGSTFSVSNDGGNGPSVTDSITD
jgi:hypothetical protein